MLPLSFLPVALSSLLFSFLLSVSAAHDQLFEGDLCTVNNGTGTCMVLQQCLSVYEELRKGNPPSAVCGYVGFQPFVCCPSKTESTTTTTDKYRAPYTSNSGSVARTKCDEYSRVFHEVNRPISDHPENSSDVMISVEGIIGGITAEMKEFPHMAAVGYNSTNDIVYSCGGTLISERFVLTAAHCLYSVQWGPAEWVLLGDINLNTTENAEQNRRLVRVIKRIRHPDLNRPALYHDIALLELESNVTFNEWIIPICLPYSSPDVDNQKAATASGWGTQSLDDEFGTNNLYKVAISIIDHARCNQSTYDSRIVPRGIVDDWQICAGDPGRDTCQGDSGGPLMIMDPGYFYMHRIIGITSFGQPFCGGNVPTVYTRVSNYLGWIERTVWPDLVRRDNYPSDGEPFLGLIDDV